MNGSKEQAMAYIQEHAKTFTDVSAFIWEHPELSLKEFEATKYYVQVLREQGFEVEENLGGIATAFVGRYGHGRPVIAFLGEYDALSAMSQERGADHPRPLTEGGAGHGCGHNMLGAGDLAAACTVKDYLQRTGREGTVCFYGCPGEEGGAGKAFLARERAWEAVDAALTWHPSDVNEVVSGSNNASIQVLYEFHGIAAHAAGDPEHGRSALDAVELMNTGVQYLREHMSSDCRVHYAILDAGGQSPNVVQARASALYMVRSNKVRETVRLLERVDKIAEGAALMTETSYDRIFIDGTAELVPNFTLEEALYENFRAAGVPDYTEEEWDFARRVKPTCPADPAPGIASRFDEAAAEESARQSENGTRALNDYLMPLVHSTGFVPGSSDVGDVGWQTPTAQIHVCSFISGAPGHSWQNVSCGGTSIGDKALLKAGEVLAMTAIDLYEDPELLKRARSEWQRRSKDGYVCPIEADAVPRAL